MSDQILMENCTLLFIIITFQMHKLYFKDFCKKQIKRITDITFDNIACHIYRLQFQSKFFGTFRIHKIKIFETPKVYLKKLML